MTWTGAGEVIDRQVVQLTRLIDDLLDVSRISSGKIQLKPEVTPRPPRGDRPWPAESLAAADRLEAARADRGPRSPSRPCRVDGDPARLQQTDLQPRWPTPPSTPTRGAGSRPLGRASEGRLRRWSGWSTTGWGSRPRCSPRSSRLFTQVDSSLGPVAGRPRDRPEPGQDAGRDARRVGRRAASDGLTAGGVEFTIRLPISARIDPHPRARMVPAWPSSPWPPSGPPS